MLPADLLWWYTGYDVAIDVFKGNPSENLKTAQLYSMYRGVDYVAGYLSYAYFAHQP